MTQPTVEKTLAGLYLTITIYIVDAMRSYATLTLTDEGKAYLDDGALGSIDTETAFREMSEDLEKSGALFWIRPEDIGALTEAPMFTDEAAEMLARVRGHETFITLPTKGVFYDANYQIADAFQTMLDIGEARFVWHQPEVEDKPLTEDEQKALELLQSSSNEESEATTW